MTAQNQKLKKDGKKLREKESSLNAELEETKHDLGMCDSSLPAPCKVTG